MHEIETMRTRPLYFLQQFLYDYFLRNILQQKRSALHGTEHLRKQIYGTIKKCFSYCAHIRKPHTKFMGLTQHLECL
jgi:hypothetical protein